MSGPVLLITGASTGIGAATARHAAREGFRLVLAARSEDKIAALADELGGSKQAIAIRCDVTEWSDQRSMVEAALEAFGQIDVAFANAGFTVGENGLVNGDPGRWRGMVLTNVYGVALTIKATVPELRRTRGHLLLTSSVLGRCVLAGSLYSATKFAVTGLGEAARQELVGSGVRVTLIEPGMVNTPFYDAPIEGILDAEDIARAVMFAVTQPKHVAVNEVLVRRTDEEL